MKRRDFVRLGCATVLGAAADSLRPALADSPAQHPLHPQHSAAATAQKHAPAGAPDFKVERGDPEPAKIKAVVLPGGGLDHQLMPSTTPATTDGGRDATSGVPDRNHANSLTAQPKARIPRPSCGKHRTKPRTKKKRRRKSTSKPQHTVPFVPKSDRPTATKS